MGHQQLLLESLFSCLDSFIQGLFFPHSLFSGIHFYCVCVWGGCAPVCSCMLRPEHNISCQPRNSVHLLWGRVSYWSGVACTIRLEWLAHESQVSCLSLLSIGITDVCANTWHFYMCSWDWTPVLMLSRQALYQPSHLLNMVSLWWCRPIIQCFKELRAEEYEL